MDVVRVTLSKGLAPVVAGIGIGLILFLVCGRLIASLLFKVSPHDPWVLSGVSDVLLATGLLARSSTRAAHRGRVTRPAPCATWVAWSCRAISASPEPPRGAPWSSLRGSAERHGDASH